jgi:hypothetical protein
MDLGEAFNDTFPKVACDLGLLLAPKVMDAESACALWEEANRPICKNNLVSANIFFLEDV